MTLESLTRLRTNCGDTSKRACAPVLTWKRYKGAWEHLRRGGGLAITDTTRVLSLVERAVAPIGNRAVFAAGEVASVGLSDRLENRAVKCRSLHREAGGEEPIEHPWGRTNRPSPDTVVPGC